MNRQHMMRHMFAATLAILVGIAAPGDRMRAEEGRPANPPGQSIWRPAGAITNSHQNGAPVRLLSPTPIPTEPDRIERLEGEIEQLKKQLNDAVIRRIDPQPLEADALIDVEPVCTECPPDGVHSFSSPEHIFGTEYPTLKWSGFLQLDSGWVYQDDANQRTVGDVDPQAGLRRVRLRASGDIRHDSSYIIDLDFAASGHPSFRDVVLILHDVPLLQNLKFGYFQQPFGMDAMTSGRELLFLERPFPFAFDPFRQTGIAAYGNFAGERGTWATSTYWFPTNDFGVFEGGSGGHALAGRVTLLPVDRGDGHLIHVGAGYSMGDPGDNTVRYAIEPGFFVTDPTANDPDGTVPVIVDTGNIPTSIYNLFNAELAAAYGPFHVQSEARFAVVDQIGGPLLNFPGYYAIAGYNLTGETRPYDRRRGVFQQTIPHRDYEIGQGGGAWEVAAGWEYIDLNDHNIQGRRASGFRFGLNWYLNQHVKFAFNIINVTLDDPIEGRSRAWVGASRVQAEF